VHDVISNSSMLAETIIHEYLSFKAVHADCLFHLPEHSVHHLYAENEWILEKRNADFNLN
jgi:hypothetical protein